MYDNQYWDLSILKNSTKEQEEFIKNFINKGEKTKLHLNTHSCMNRRYPLFIEGKEYYIDVSNGFLDMPKYKRCKITGLRAGIVFYIELDNPSTEHYMHEFSLAHYFSEPAELSLPLDGDYYEVVPISGMMKVNYTEKAI